MKNKHKKRKHSPLSFSDSDSGASPFEQLDFPSPESSCHPIWGSSLTFTSQMEPQEFDNLSNYLPRWPITGRRGRHSTIIMGEKQNTETKKSVLESEPIGNKGDYPAEKHITIDTDTKVNNLLEKGKGKPVMEYSDDFENIGEDEFDTEKSNSTIPSEAPSVSNQSFKKKNYMKKHDYFREQKIETEYQSGSLSRFPSNGAREDSKSPVISTPTRRKVLPFDLNDLPPMEEENDTIERKTTTFVSEDLARIV